MAIPWDMIFDFLFKMLEGCEDTPEKRAEAVATRPMAVIISVNRSLRSAGFRGRDLRKARAEVMQEINEASEEEIKAFSTSGAEGYYSLKMS